MAFNSLAFLVFFPVVLALYFLLPHRVRWMVLLAASYFFYMYWKPAYGLLLFGVTLVAYLCAIVIEQTPRKQQKRHQLVICLVLLLGVLFVYKYFNFLGLREVVWVISSTLGYDDTVRVPAACR